MSSNDIIVFTSLGTAIVALFSVAFAVISHRREINASIYLDLSDRLHRLLQSLPAEVRATQFAGEELIESPAALAGVADFLHIINSAYTLYSSGYFSGKLWGQLRIQAERGLQLPLCRAQWPALRATFSRNPEFVAFVEACQAGE